MEKNAHIAQASSASVATQQTGKRYHFLDWWRGLLIICVVFAHLSFSDLETDMEGSLIIDTHSYASPGHKSTLLVRYNSIVRQFCIPTLMWISGASGCLTHKSQNFNFWSAVKLMVKLALVSCVGVASNGILWNLGPRDDKCTASHRCHGKGVLFDFTFIPFMGNVFPYIFQMWFSMALMLFIPMTYPLMHAMVTNEKKLILLGLQYAAMVAAWGFCIFSGVKSGEVGQPAYCFVCVSVLELVFMYLSQLNCNGVYGRLQHYACAFIIIFQIGLPPYSQTAFNGKPGGGYGCYMGLVFVRFYNLGALMMNNHDLIEPILSRFWPIVVVLWVGAFPSTNFVMGGSLTYPYFPHWIDRCMYVTGAVCVVFVTDRVSRVVHVLPLPNAAALSGLVLYMFHPWVITLLIKIGITSFNAVFWLMNGVVIIVTITSVVPEIRAAFRDGPDPVGACANVQAKIN